MAFPLYITTLIPVAIFGLLIVVLLRTSGITNSWFSLFILGGAGASLVSLVLLGPRLFFYSEASANAYTDAINGYKGLLFWFIFISAAISEVVRYRAIHMLKYFEKRYLRSIIFGLGWTVAVISVDYLFFFDSTYSNFNRIVFYLYVFIFEASISLVYIRSEENTKFVMFGIFMKLIAGIAIFGAFANNVDAIESLWSLLIIVVLQLFMIFFAMVAMKYKMED
ncbi:MAG: hypothetical protein INQ03_14930 [Candidatus Heimdallarchaeota archaeon]|nr:hypothetical protein [Candidatus Heimdallarchaeota archaeon]